MAATRTERRRAGSPGPRRCRWPGLLGSGCGATRADTGRCGSGPGLCGDGGPAVHELAGLPAGTRVSLQSSSVLALAPAHGGVVAATSTSQVSRSLWMEVLMLPQANEACQSLDDDSQFLRQTAQFAARYMPGGPTGPDCGRSIWTARFQAASVPRGSVARRPWLQHSRLTQVCTGLRESPYKSFRRTPSQSRACTPRRES